MTITASWTRPPRVLHVVPALFDRAEGILGGAERYALELAGHMSNETPTRLVTFGPHDRRFRQDRLEVRVLGRPWRVRGETGNPFALRLLAELRWADVIHCHQRHIVASSVCALFARASGRRAFVSDLGGGGWDVSAFLNTDRWYDGHLHLSDYSRRVYGQDDAPSSHVIYGGVDLEKFAPGPAGERNGTVLFVGRLRAHKGVDDLIEALPAGMEARIVGSPVDPSYLSLLRELARGRSVRFDLECDDDQLAIAYRRSLCLVLPSVYRDRFGRETRVPELLGQVVLEAMASATPAVCTRVASLPEIVEDGRTGFLVPPNDPRALGERLRYLRENPEVARTMGLAARESVERRFT